MSEWLTHKGKEYLYINYEKTKSQEEMLVILNESFEKIRQSEGRILVLSNVTGASIGPDFMKVAKEQGKDLVGKSEKTAIIGVTGLKKMLLKGYNLFTGDVIEPFDTKEEALEFLVS